jgi:hypothetical protein
MSDRTGQSPVGDFCGGFLNLGLARTKSDGAGQCPVGALRLGVVSRVGICLSLFFHFILHTPLNSTVYLNSRNVKIYCSMA